MTPFFLTGLPRSRLGWLANFLTAGRSFCYHAALANCARMEHLETLLYCRPDGSEFVGDADPLLGCVAGDFIKTFPQSRVVCIFRSYREVYDEESRAIAAAGIHLSSDELARWMKMTSDGLHLIWSVLAPARRMWVPYGDLDQVETIRRIWHFCLPDEVRFPEARFRMLDCLRVTQICEKVLRVNPEQPFKQMIIEKESQLCTAH